MFKDHKRETDSPIEDKEMELSSTPFEAADEKENVDEEQVSETAESISTLSFTESDDPYHKTEFLVELSIAVKLVNSTKY